MGIEVKKVDGAKKIIVQESGEKNLNVPKDSDVYQLGWRSSEEGRKFQHTGIHQRWNRDTLHPDRPKPMPIWPRPPEPRPCFGRFCPDPEPPCPRPRPEP